MDTARQVVRWSIPGWVFLFILCLIQTITWLLQGLSARSILEAEATVVTPAAIAAVVTAGVPLGFILYQIYYSWYGKVLPFGFVNRDRGADVLAALPPAIQTVLCGLEKHSPDLEDMAEPFDSFLLTYPLRRLKPQYRNQAGIRRFEAKVHENWDLVRFWLNRICLINQADALKTEVTTLADIYHAVGAARTALFLSCILHFTFNLIAAQRIVSSGWHLASMILPYIFVLWLFRVFERTRASALTSLLSILTLAFMTYPAGPSTTGTEH